MDSLPPWCNTLERLQLYIYVTWLKILILKICNIIIQDYKQYIPNTKRIRKYFAVLSTRIIKIELYKASKSFKYVHKYLYDQFKTLECIIPAEYWYGTLLFK